MSSTLSPCHSFYCFNIPTDFSYSIVHVSPKPLMRQIFQIQTYCNILVFSLKSEALNAIKMATANFNLMPGSDECLGFLQSKNLCSYEILWSHDKTNGTTFVPFDMASFPTWNKRITPWYKQKTTSENISCCFSTGNSCLSDNREDCVPEQL